MRILGSLGENKINILFRNTLYVLINIEEIIEEFSLINRILETIIDTVKYISYTMCRTYKKKLWTELCIHKISQIKIQYKNEITFSTLQKAEVKKKSSKYYINYQ